MVGLVSEGAELYSAALQQAAALAERGAQETGGDGNDSGGGGGGGGGDGVPPALRGCEAELERRLQVSGRENPQAGGWVVAAATAGV
jgi:hypothetical protein